jgi:hypothetical protein
MAQQSYHFLKVGQKRTVKNIDCRAYFIEKKENGYVATFDAMRRSFHCKMRLK